MCEACVRWFHAHCVHLSAKDIAGVREYHCADCVDEHGETLWKRASGRARNQVDYRALDQGDVDEAIVVKVHPHIAALKHWQGTIKADTITGAELTVEYALRTGIPAPLKINADQTAGLGFVIPPFDVEDLVRELGGDHTLEVMDVLTQNSTRDKWSMSKWRDYFRTAEDSRERILNVLSLEISNTPLGESIKRPTYVEQIDLVDKVWPEESPGKPVVQKYCLMGVKDSYTDFHLDFAGTSVYYTVIYGEKSFMFFPPTQDNLKKYVQWITTPELTPQFLGSMGLERGLKVSLYPGDVMIIPSGWIHAVYTPIDTLVIGGNFLTSFNIIQQLKIIDIEKKTKVGKKFKFPNFSRLMFLTAWAITKNELKLGHDIDERGVRELIDYLKGCLETKNRDGVPKVVGNGKVLLRKLEAILIDNAKDEFKDEQDIKHTLTTDERNETTKRLKRQ